MTSVHDNETYLYVVAIREKRIVLHTVLPGWDPYYVDIVFSGVDAFQFDEVNIGQNVLYVIVEIASETLFQEYRSLFEPTDIGGIIHGYSWLPFRYSTEEQFIALLAQRELKCFDIQTSMGLCGFVISKQCERVVRVDRANAV